MSFSARSHFAPVHLALFAALAFTPLCAGAADSGPRNIVEMGCHTRDSTCWVVISGNPVGPAACNQRVLRWDQSADANAKSILALLSMAFATSKPVSFEVADFCYTQQPAFPTFAWINVL